MTVVPRIDTQVKGHCSLYACIFFMHCHKSFHMLHEHKALYLGHNLIIILYWIDSGCFQAPQSSVMCITWEGYIP